MTLQIVIPMAGKGSRFQQAGYTDPKPFIKINGKRMIEMVVENLTPKCEHRFIFIAQKEHLEVYNGYEILNKAAPGCVIIPIEGITEGAACTVLLAKDYIDNQNQLLIANSDQYVQVDINEFLNDMNKSVQASIMTMERTESKWSFVGRNRHFNIDQVVEKKPISKEATVGIYLWQFGFDFVECANLMIEKNLRHNGEFYVAPVFQELIDQGGRVDGYEIPAEKFHGLGTPEDLELFLKKSV